MVEEWPPGVLGVKQQVVLGGAAEGRALLPQLGLQPAGQPVAALGLPVVLHRVGGGAHAVCPPVGQIPAVHRAVRQGLPDGAVQLLEGHHPQLHALGIALVVGLYQVEDFQVRRSVVVEQARDAGNDKIVGVAVFLAQGEVAFHALVEGFHIAVGGGDIPEEVGRHAVGVPVGGEAQHVAQVVVLAVPHQQAPAGEPVVHPLARQRQGVEVALGRHAGGALRGQGVPHREGAAAAGADTHKQSPLYPLGTAAAQLP